MIRKTALLGCKEGNWIRTSGMKGLRLNAKVQRDVMVRVEFTDHQDQAAGHQIVVGPGVHNLMDAIWARVVIVDGPHYDAICLFEAA